MICTYKSLEGLIKMQILILGQGLRFFILKSNRVMQTFELGRARGYHSEMEKTCDSFGPFRNKKKLVLD